MTYLDEQINLNIKKTERKINEVEDVADKNNELLKVSMQQM